ncbi:MAG: ABC transporter ATP-binding protein [Candidatus Verstraetearchaeota archaeon]|nr:ABC transporter ATP-binding protein [Candidatus Verstraetearchaeota archaeon]
MNIRAERLYKKFPKVWALNNIDFSISTDNLALIGPNGSGKTTLLSIIAGLRRPSAGRLEIDGIEPYRDREAAFNDFSYLFEKPKIPLRVRVRELIGILKEEENASEVERLCKELGIESFQGQRIGNLSSGQAQLCGLLVAMSSTRKLLILDEPFVHLDAYRATIVLENLSKRRGLIIATHSPEEAEAVSDHFVIMNEGKIMWCGNHDDLYHEGVFEVFLKAAELPEDTILVSKFGRSALVKSSEERLMSLYAEGRINGFRKAGLRHVYAKNYPRV